MHLHGRGRGLPFTGVLFAIGGLMLSAIPVVTLFFGKSLLDGASLEDGYPWLPSIYVISSMFTGGAVLRVAGRVFLGWGPAEQSDTRQAAQAREEESEESGAGGRTPPLMLLVPALLLAATAAIGVIPGAVPAIGVAAAHFGDHHAYLRWVLHGGVAHFSPVPSSHIQGYDYLYGAGATLGALALAALALFGAPLRRRLPGGALHVLTVALGGLRHLHSGHIGDYIAWWTAGAAMFGGASLIFLR